MLQLPFSFSVQQHWKLNPSSAVFKCVHPSNLIAADLSSCFFEPVQMRRVDSCWDNPFTPTRKKGFHSISKNEIHQPFLVGGFNPSAKY
jgi:hypothetical protein